MNIKLALATNYNLKTDIIAEEHYDKLNSVAYEPMLDMLRSLQIKSDHFPVGWTTEYLAQNYPKTVKAMADLFNCGLANLGSHTYGHAILPLIPTRDAKKQIEFEIAADKKIFGRRPIGFYPPEWAFDFSLPNLAAEFDLRWLLLHGGSILGGRGQTEKDMLVPKLIRGLNNYRCPTVFVYAHKNLIVRENIFRVLEGSLRPEEFAKFFLNKIARDADNLPEVMVILYIDMETAFFAKNDYNPNPVKRLHEALSSIYCQKNIESILVTEIVQHATDDVTPQLFTTYKPINLWISGSEKLDTLINEARHAVYAADDAVPNSHNACEAWKNLLLAEGSDPRIAVSKRRFKGIPLMGNVWYGNMQRVIEAYEYAINAKKLALAAVDER